MREFSDLIGRIYDTVVNPELWPVVLNETCRYTNTSRSLLIFEDAVEPERSIFRLSARDPEFEKLYLRTYLLLNPARLATIGQVKPGDVVLTTDYTTRKDFSNSRFAREFLAQRQIIDVAAVILEMTSTSVTVLSVTRSKDQGYAGAAVRRKLEGLAPHFRRAINMSRFFEDRSLKGASLAATLDGLAAAVFLLDHEGVVVHMNRAAQEILRNGNVFKSGRYLIPFESGARTVLLDALTAAREGDTALGVKGLSIPLKARDGRAFVGVILPLSTGERRSTSARYQAVAAFGVREVTAEPPMPSPALAELYNLTRREMTVLVALVGRGGIPEISEILGISEDTTKTHLKAIFRKTGTNRQADLVKLMANADSLFP